METLAEARLRRQSLDCLAGDLRCRIPLWDRRGESGAAAVKISGCFSVSAFKLRGRNRPARMAHEGAPLEIDVVERNAATAPKPGRSAKSAAAHLLQRRVTRAINDLDVAKAIRNLPGNCITGLKQQHRQA